MCVYKQYFGQTDRVNRFCHFVSNIYSKIFRNILIFHDVRFPVDMIRVGYVTFRESACLS